MIHTKIYDEKKKNSQSISDSNSLFSVFTFSTILVVTFHKCENKVFCDVSNIENPVAVVKKCGRHIYAIHSLNLWTYRNERTLRTHIYHELNIVSHQSSAGTSLSKEDKRRGKPTAKFSNGKRKQKASVVTIAILLQQQKETDSQLLNLLCALLEQLISIYVRFLFPTHCGCSRFYFSLYFPL